jgi:hypothetical protein
LDRKIKKDESNFKSFVIMILDKKQKRRMITLMNIVPLFEVLVKEILSAEEKFFENPRDFYSLENSVKTSTEAFAAAFLGSVLSSMDEHIYNSSWRDCKYIVQRKDKRTLISSLGDVTFDCTYYRGIGDHDGFAHILENLIGLERNEKFTEAAEVAILCEAVKTSYNEATKVLPSRQKITKTTVMNKIHGIAEEIPDVIYEERKSVPYLFIEADEDHVAEQHGRADDKYENKSFQSKLVYIYEFKQETSVKGRYELVNKYYFGGLYPGKEGNKALWEKVARFIDTNYDYDSLRKVFISGDGAAWIKSGTSVIDKSVFCADKYHLMQYINAAAGQMLDEKEVAKENLWHILNSKKGQARNRFDEYTKEMLAAAKNPDRVEQLRAYVLGNWSAVRRTLRNKLVMGCSAESHISHVLSDRLSSRPMGWSQTGADRMSKLRCFERNNGRAKILDLVKYSRNQRRLAATGTENMVPHKFSMKEIMNDHYNQARSYIDRIQAEVMGGTAKKIISIREGLNLL